MDLLNDLVIFFAEHGYTAVVLALLVCSLGVPIPEDLTLVAGGVISGLGYTNVHVMVGVAIVFVIVGDAMMFSLGHHFGVRLLRWRPMRRLLTPSRFAAVQRKFDRHGNHLLFIARFLPGIRTPVFISAGLTHRVSLARFILFDGLAALISVPIWVYLGYAGANNHAWLVKWMHRGQAGLWTALGLIALAVALYWWRKRRRTRDSTQTPP